MRIGIPIDNTSKIYSNGLRYNALLWYQFLTKCGHDVYILLIDKSKLSLQFVDESKIKYLDDIIVKKNGFLKVKPDCIDIRPDLFDFDLIIVLSLTFDEYFNYIRKCNIKILYILLGSTYHNDVSQMIYDKNSTVHTDYVSDRYDEVWISPHFKYCQEYYKIRYNTEKVFICPYIWSSFLMDSVQAKQKVLTDVRENLKVGIVEANLEQAKNCLIPITICEKAEKHIKSVMVFNTDTIKNGKFFKDFILNSHLHKAGKISVEGRYQLPVILTKYCNCIVSYVEDCDLNYVFLECFYLGIPLIHNSPMLKDYGYYYPRLNVTKGAEQIENVIKNHNREEYIKKHEPILQKYSLDNLSYIGWTNMRLKGQAMFDCE